MPTYRKEVSPVKSTGGLAPVTPLEVDRVRRSVLDVVRRQIPSVRLVLDGNKNWNNQQVRLFGMMLNKVMPDLHHSFNEHAIENKAAHELTFDELQAIAAQANTPIEDEHDVIDATGSSSTPTINNESKG
tara:strand:+ start:597 stop:986 length:390 start_codon:yes stop_codon:yes gene_type:complete